MRLIIYSTLIKSRFLYLIHHQLDANEFINREKLGYCIYKQIREVFNAFMLSLDPIYMLNSCLALDKLKSVIHLIMFYNFILFFFKVHLFCTKQKYLLSYFSIFIRTY